MEQVEAQLEYPGLLLDVEEIKRLLVRPSPARLPSPPLLSLTS